MTTTTIIKSVIAAAGVVVLSVLGSTAVAAADGPQTTVSVQPGDGSAIDPDGTQGNIVVSLGIARPQIKAKISAEQNRP